MKDPGSGSANAKAENEREFSPTWAKPYEDWGEIGLTTTKGFEIRLRADRIDGYGQDNNSNNRIVYFGSHVVLVKETIEDIELLLDAAKFGVPNGQD